MKVLSLCLSLCLLPLAASAADSPSSATATAAAKARSKAPKHLKPVHPVPKAKPAPQAAAPAAGAHWVCPMHDSPASDKPGKCPACGMDLVKEEAPAK